MVNPVRSNSQGFTLIELLVVLAIMALLLTIATPRYIQHVERARETTLRSSLKVMREAIDKFAGDQGRLPANLDELVARNYLKAIPLDPVTGKRDTWIPMTQAEAYVASGADPAASQEPPAAPQPGMADIHSGAAGNGQDGSAYTQW